METSRFAGERPLQQVDAIPRPEPGGIADIIPAATTALPGGNGSGLREERAKVAPIKPARGFLPVKFQPRWVSTQNIRQFNAIMEVVKDAEGDGVLVAVIGSAGLGKTRTVRHYASNNDCIYVLCLEDWNSSSLGMLQKLCRELGMERPPGRKYDCILEVVDRLIRNPRPIFLDEVDLVPKRMELVRQLTELTAVPIILVGENRLADHITKNERTWSRTLKVMRFEPVSLADIILYMREAACLEVPEDAARELRASPGGWEWRVIRRLTIELIEIANHYQSRVVTMEMARMAIKMGIKGKTG